MGRYLSKARHHAERIEYYHKIADQHGYAQAVYHWEQLSGLAYRADRSKNDKSDTPMILGIRESVQYMMDEMKERAKKPDSA